MTTSILQAGHTPLTQQTGEMYDGIPDIVAASALTGQEWLGLAPDNLVSLSTCTVTVADGLVWGASHRGRQVRMHV